MIPLPPCAATTPVKRGSVTNQAPYLAEETCSVWLARGGSISLSAIVSGQRIRQRLVPGANVTPAAMIEVLAQDADFRVHIELGHILIEAPEPTLAYAYRALAAIEALYQDGSAPARASAAFCRSLLRAYLADPRANRAVREKAEHVIKTLDRIEAQRRV